MEDGRPEADLDSPRERSSDGDYPLQPAKVQRPFLREETLNRDRLLDWLHRRIHSRLVLVTAEAGYGKTTLLADFSRRTRLRTAWYRLDELDRNTISFLHYLVAAGREIDPDFAPGTAALLRDLGSTAISEDRIVETFLRELGRLGQQPTVLIVDDYHLVDDVPDVRRLVRQLIANAPERLSIVLISRRRPPLPLARLRSLGEVAELAADDLRFSREETEQLFREAYGEPLEADVLADLTRRTEGWAASLELVRTALHGRNAVEIRSFVRSLSGASHELYDYLAEEVVGDLDPDAQRFLMRTAVLQVVRPDLAVVASAMEEIEVRDQIAAAERLGLLGGRGVRAPRSHRYHPLVRDFLLHRLEREIGAAGVAELHRVVARHADGTDWVLAAHHYAEANEPAEVRRVVADSLAEIMGRGEFALAESYLTRYPPDEPNAAFEVLLSRLEYYTGLGDSAVDRASRALGSALSTAHADSAAANLMSLRLNVGDASGALELANLLVSTSVDNGLVAIADSLRGLLAASLDGDLRAVARSLERAADLQEKQRQFHFHGVSMLNLACVQYLRGEVDEAASSASAAIDTLRRTSDATERDVARAVLASALLHQRQTDDAMSVVADALAGTPDAVRAEVLAEIGDAIACFLDPEAGQRMLDEAVEALPANPGAYPYVRQCRGRNLVRLGRLDEAARELHSWPGGRITPYIGLEAARLGGEALLRLRSDPDGARELAIEAHRIAARQGAVLHQRITKLLIGLSQSDPSELSAIVAGLSREDPAILSALAEPLSERLDALDPVALGAIVAEAEARPRRWAHALRRTLDAGPPSLALIEAATLLEAVGDHGDVPRLRRFARAVRSRQANGLGRDLARRTAPRIFVEDLGRIHLRIGDRDIQGTAVRRKVLGLLTLLLTKPDLSATRDQVIDALWPEADPDDAGNSLNQTVYFLRRLIEPSYKEDLSPGFVHHRSDVVWLDPDLVDSRSRRCMRLLAELSRTRDPATAEQLGAEYSSRFALDFEYEDWADTYRDALHAAFLEGIERQVLDDLGGGHYDRGIRLARGALRVDATADSIELALIRLYDRSGAHAAAAEQRSHYETSDQLDRTDWADR